MKSKTQNKSYREWFSADELHVESKKWNSELEFAKDEQKFLNNMVKDYTLDIIDANMFNTIKPVVEMLDTLEKDLQKLFKRVRLHENQLQIMVDDVDQKRMENAYLDTHADLKEEVEEYFEQYRDTKTKMFNIVSKVIKKKKQKRLLN
ncbi:hypothetical protein [Flagellimonas nanhaiensis]|uniref:Uncharacterized protein n=1 Tax=Flagellimonas nanhaiensis TaxID=2292706 RepID=A0A371JM92_9FLAO|nr:hypothetical protein [Allomuricauda nanhaiensis]RDY58187.1 hypothetical protein DX873_16080 [Allomuricauda nanhaiensis]